MNHENHHTLMSKDEYNKKKLEWNNFLKINRFVNFITENKLAEKIQYVAIF